MREILFRGKRTYNGKWVEGSLVITAPGNAYIISTVENKRNATALVNQCSINVDPETVGQYTGLTDKNGKKIFEGDIMRNDGNVVEFCGGGFCINGDSPLSYWTGTEVIGNIHDNSEILNNPSP